LLIHKGRERNSPFARALFLSNTADECIEALGIASTYLVGMNESGNQKVNLSYLAGTKKQSDSLIESYFHKALHKRKRGRLGNN
jgi:hypothetical protein